MCDSVDELKGQILCDGTHRRALKWSPNQEVERCCPGLEGGRGGNVIQQCKVSEVENGCLKDLYVTLNLWLNYILYFKLCWKRCCVGCVLFFPPSLLLSLFLHVSLVGFCAVHTPGLTYECPFLCIIIQSYYFCGGFLRCPYSQSLNNCHGDGDLSSLPAIELQIVLWGVLGNHQSSPQRITTGKTGKETAQSFWLSSSINQSNYCGSFCPKLAQNLI